MTTDRDLVAELRQRVQRASEVRDQESDAWVQPDSLNTGNALDDALNSLEYAAHRSARAAAPDPAVVAVASALLGFRADAQDEWCVFAGDDPATTPARVVGLSRWSRAQTLRDRINARDFRPGSDLDDVFGQSPGPARIARRASWSSLHRTPWQVVDTEGGEPRG